MVLMRTARRNTWKFFILELINYRTLWMLNGQKKHRHKFQKDSDLTDQKIHYIKCNACKIACRHGDICLSCTFVLRSNNGGQVPRTPGIPLTNYRF